MTVTLYGLKTCDTCRKAIAALEGAGRQVAFVDMRAGTDLSSKVPAWLAAVGADVLVNRRSTTWRNLGEDERAGEAEPLLVANPTLIKRPVIEAGDDVHVGWSKAVQSELL